MHIVYRAIFTTSLALSLTACDRTDEETQAYSRTTATEAPATISKPVVELPHGDGAPEPFPIAPGSFLSGEFKSPRRGSLASLSVQIGNYANSADGNLSVGLCQGGRCTSGLSKLHGSADNQYLEVLLEPELDLGDTEAVTYRLIKDGGSSSVAVWLYAAEAPAQVSVNNETNLQRIPKIALRFSR